MEKYGNSNCVETLSHGHSVSDITYWFLLQIKDQTLVVAIFEMLTQPCVLSNRQSGGPEMDFGFLADNYNEPPGRSMKPHPCRTHILQTIIKTDEVQKTFLLKW
ncbi:Hypothetical predicted protein [Xyrichtys novacula]|uniref:Uncharacterized protein n=1 Tax=Xyrichtys novacula TaxID=13765 RepID=A0AAV1GHH2_XYRNO|nr:Hypothetical predicted protein [Xyrichtys novacula]